MQDRQPRVSSCTSLALSGTPLSCLSKRWGSGHCRPSCHPSRALRNVGAENVAASRRGHQGFPFPPSQMRIMRTSTSQPHPIPFPSQALFVELTQQGVASLSEFSCCSSSFILRHRRSEAITDTKSLFFCVPAGEV